MTRNTTHHQWPVQEPGDTNYEDTFDTLVNTLDVDVVLKDTEANRPAAGTQDRWFLATDTLSIYYDDGSAWHAVDYTDEQARDATSAMLASAGNISLTKDDTNDTVTIDTTALNAEQVEDQVNTLLGGGTGITTSYDDANNTLTISVSSGGITATEIASAAVTASEIASGAVGDAELAKSYTAAGDNESISGTWTFNAKPDLSPGFNVQGRFEWDYDSKYDFMRVFDADGTSIYTIPQNGPVNFNAGAQVSGNTVLTTADEGDGGGLNADQWEGYDLQKNGTDGTGVINFKT